MRLVAAVSTVAAAALAVLPFAPRAQTGASSSPTPVPKADGGPAAPPKAEPAPKADADPPAPPKAEPAPKANAPRDGAATKPPAAANDLARALLTSEQWGKVLDSYASSLAGQLSQALQSKGEKVPGDLGQKLRAELEKTLPYQQTVQAQAEALARTLTPDELRRTATFYASPLGRKVLDKLPEAQSEVAQSLQARLSTAVPEIVNRLAPRALSGSPGGAGNAPDHGTGSSGGADPGPTRGGEGAGSSTAR